MAKLYTANGKTQTLYRWAIELGMSRQGLEYRLRKGLPLDEVFCKNEGYRRDGKFKKRSFGTMKEMLQWLHEANHEKYEDADGYIIESVNPLTWSLISDGIPKMAEVPKRAAKIHRIGDVILADMVYLSKRFQIPIGLTQLFLINLMVPVLNFGDRAYFNLGVFEKRIAELSKVGGEGFSVTVPFLKNKMLKNIFGLTNNQVLRYNEAQKALVSDMERRANLKQKARKVFPLLPAYAGRKILEEELRARMHNEGE